MAKVVIPIIDYGDEKSAAAFNVSDTILDADITALFDAVNGVSIGTLEKSMLVISTNKDTGSSTPPVNQYAQRELKWLLKYSDNDTGKRYTMEIPCADLTLLSPNTEFMNLTAGAGLALKAAFDDQVFSPAGNYASVTLLSAKLVGRNF